MALPVYEPEWKKKNLNPSAIGVKRAGTGNKTLTDMVANGGTPEEISSYLSTGAVPTSYTERYKPQNYVFWNAGNSTIGDAGIDNSNESTWKQIADLYGAGDVAGATALVNELSNKGLFGGYYDNDGNYWGFAQGYKGGANASYQPVLGGKLMNTGLDTTGTTIWLTPDGKALHMGEGGALSDNGDTWSHTQQYDIAADNLRMKDILADGAVKGAQLQGEIAGSSAVPNSKGGYDYSIITNPATPEQQAIAAAQQSTPGVTGGTTPGTTPYMELVNQTDATSGTTGGGTTGTTPDTTPYAAYMAQYEGEKAPEYAGDPYKERRDAALERAESMTWNYNPETDPVWLAYQKQYRREGQRATEDTLGRLAGMTGGMPSSYAATAAAQAGNYYASQLSDKLPQLYQDAYNRYLDEYKKQLGISDQYYQFGQQDYNMFQDTLDQWNKDRSFNYGAYRDLVGDQRYADETAYNRYRDTVADARYDQEWAQKLREYADEQGWKQKDWDQYLREYGDKLSQQEREWVYKLSRDAVSDSRYEDETAYDRYVKNWEMNQSNAKLAAQYGDMSGLQGLGIDTSKADAADIAYADDGSTYRFSTYDAQYFVNNAGNGTTMKGGDGSIWRKDEYGNITIEKNGKTYRYGQLQTGEDTGSGYTGSRYIGNGGNGGNTPTSDTDALSQMVALGLKSRAQAYSWLLANGYDKSAASFSAAEKLADYYAQMIGEDTGAPKYDDETLEKAWKYADSTNSALKAWAQGVLSEQYGMDFSGADTAAVEDQDAGYRNFVETLEGMVRRGASRDEIFNEIAAEVKDKKITEEQGAALREKYYSKADNVSNSGRTHSNGLPQAAGFDVTMRQAEQMATMGSDAATRKALRDFLEDALDSGKIHEYEVDIILDRLGF